MNYLKMGEYFCGPGGIAMGAILASESCHVKIEPHWATDYDFDTCKTYLHNIHKVSIQELTCMESRQNLPKSIICQDIRNPHVKLESMEPCDIFSFGFPCNDFSQVGKSKGLDGEYGPLYQYGVDYLERYQPKFFFAENVGGLSSSNEGKAFKLILSSLSKAGYDIYPHLYKFEEYGIPQARHRIIIIGIRSDLDITFDPPAATHGRELLKYNTSGEALTIPPIPIEAPNQERTRQSKAVVERLKLIKPGENAWCSAVETSPYRLNVKGAKLSNIYKRLDPERPSYTVTGSGGGGTHMYHWEENRALTNRERARLQTFPDDYFFQGRKESVRKQIGMAVPPQGAKTVFDALLKSIDSISYPSTKCNIEIG